MDKERTYNSPLFHSLSWFGNIFLTVFLWKEMEMGESKREVFGLHTHTLDFTHILWTLHTYFQKTVNWADAQNNLWLTFSNIEQLVIHQNEGVGSINPRREEKSYTYMNISKL